MRVMSAVVRNQVRHTSLGLVLAVTAVFALTTLITSPASAGKPGISISVPGVALKGDIIKVKVSASGGSEGVWPHITGLQMVRGYFDHCGWCGKPCLVNDQIQACPTPPDGCCFNLYCLSCGWSSGHEFSDTWYGGPTWEFKVTGCDTATIQVEYYGGSHEGPFLNPEHEIIVLDGIEARLDLYPEEVCVGEDVLFVNNSCGGTRFDWSFGDGHTASGQEVTHSFDEPGSYNVLLTVSSSADSDQDSAMVTVSGDCATIQGQVTDSLDGSPLPGAHVAVTSVPHERYAESGVDGSYSAKVPPDTTYTINTSRRGYLDSAPASASPGPDETVTRDFALMAELQDPIDPLADLGRQWINTGDPVNPANGNLFFSRTLFSMPGKAGLNLVFDVSYNSLDHETNGPLGFGWTHSFNVSLAHTGADYTLTLPDASRRFFHYDDDVRIYTPFNCHAMGVLSDRHPDGWAYTLTGGTVYELDNQGRLERIVDARGNSISLTHSTQLDQITDPAGRQVAITYSSGRISSITSPVTAGHTATFTYDGSGNLSGITDARGNAWAFTYDAQHRMLTEHDRRGVLVLTNSYDAEGRVDSQTDALGNPTSFSRTPVNGGRTRVVITPPSGNAVAHVYDETRHLLRSTDGEGHTATFAYAANGTPASATDKTGKAATFTFEDNGNLTEVNDRLGGSLQLSYEGHGLLTEVRDELGDATGSPRDAAGNLRWLSNPDGSAVELIPDAQGLTRRLRDLRGKTWFITRTAEGLVASVEDPKDHVTTYHYDAAGRTTQVDRPGSLGSLHLVRDANGNLESTTSPGGLMTTLTHDAEDNITSRTFVPTGATSTYAYDDLQRLVTVTDAMGGVTTYGYDADSNLVSVTDPDGITTQASYDARNELISVTSPGGSQSTFSYDANGRQISVTDGLGHTWTRTYDAEGRLTTSTDALGNTTSLLRAPNERDTTVIDAIGRETLLKSTRMNDLETVVHPNGDVTSQYRDAGGTTESITDARGNTWRLSRDKVGRLTAVTGPDGATESYGYDAVGQRTSITRRNGEILEYEYDLDGRISAIHLPDGADITFAYTFDATGLTTAVTEPLGTTTVEYDLLDRPVRKTDLFGNTVQIAYTPGGRLASITYPGNHRVVYSYDSAGRLEHITDWLANVTTYHYDGLDRVNRVDLPNGTATTYGFDDAGRLISQVHEDGGGTPLVAYTITRDKLGRVASMIVSGTLADAVAVADSLREAAFDESNRMTHSSRDLAVTTYTFDADGRRVEKKTGTDTLAYSYDTLNRLIAVNGRTHTTAYSVDSAGNRIRTIYDGAETRYLRSGNRLWGVLDAANNPQRFYIGGGSILYSLDAGGNLRVFHTDPRGNVAAVTGGTGGAVATFTYDPYGRVLASTGTSELKYLGGWGVLTDENGLCQTGLRMYDPEARRFLTEDPLGLDGALNLYSYTTGDPVNRVDPSGLQGDTITWTAEVVAAVETWLQKGWEMGLREPGQFVTDVPVKIGDIYVDETLVTRHLAENYSAEDAVKFLTRKAQQEHLLEQGAPKVVEESTIRNTPSYPSSRYTTTSTSEPTPVSQFVNAVEGEIVEKVETNPSWGQRFVRGLRKRGREIIEDVALTYTIGKVLLTSNVADVAALGPENPIGIPLITGYVSGRVTSHFLPTSFNETTGKWETADEVVFNYFLPNQLANYPPTEDPYIWFRQFAERIGYSDSFKRNVPAKQ